MKKTVLSISIVAAMFLTGCTGNSETPTPVPPSNSAGPSATLSEAPSATPRVPSMESVAPPEGGGGEVNPTPNAPATTEAITPAIEFAQRWGKKYPTIEEFKILKAANEVCDEIVADPNWPGDDVSRIVNLQRLNEIADRYGLPREDMLEFGQDAKQNYCASVANPT